MKLMTAPRRMTRQEVVQILVAVAEQIRWLARKTRNFNLQPSIRRHQDWHYTGTHRQGRISTRVGS